MRHLATPLSKSSIPSLRSKHKPLKKAVHKGSIQRKKTSGFFGGSLYLLRTTLACMILASTITFPPTSAQVSPEYAPNYRIQRNRDAIVSNFVILEANKRLGKDTETSVFQSLNTNFTQIFPSFPKDNTYKIVYEQCTILSRSLSVAYEYNQFAQFMDNCFDPLNRIIQEIDSKFTVKASIAANPRQGAAPLNVTLDARASTDPSNATIPSNNFFRYFKDTNGIDRMIGRGPVVNYTFDKEGNYIINLTVRSANQTSDGIFDGSSKISIDVAPQAANIVIYAAGQRMREDMPTKIGSQEARRGIMLDASATQAKGGRKILSHKREITGDKGFKFQQAGQIPPGSIRTVFPDDGAYNITLTVKDNENNELKKTYRLLVSDPIAIIKSQPDNGTTATMFNFDASASYSVSSSIRNYKRDVFDTEGEKMETLQTKSFKKDFKKPGTYKIVLTVSDQLGNMNTETLDLFVDSSNPVAQFTYEPVQERALPSQFIFDAGASSDEDVVNGNDQLTYDWKFSNTENVVRERTEDNGKRIIVSFNQKGEYLVQLNVRDSFGKVASVERKIKVDSGLRPVMNINPIATSRGERINFRVDSNKPLVNYSRNFGDGQTRTVQTNEIFHTYDKAGVYDVILKVTDPTGEENQITRKVFIGEKNSPVSSFTVEDEKGTILTQTDSCEGKPAYRIERQQNFKIDIKNSVNIKGQTSKDLNIFFQPKNDDIYNRSDFGYRFTELGCTYIDLTVEDTSIGKNDRQKIYFKVVNALPKINNLIMYFPQYGNQYGIGFNQNQQKDIFKLSYDPLIVRIVAQSPNPIDADGVVSYYTFYYYKKENPGRILEAKVTPGSIPYAYFSLPTGIPGEFMFGVKITDNDGGETKSEDVIGNGPIVFFPPNGNNTDVPIVTLRVDRVNIDAGDEVKFDVISRTLANRPDFVQNRTIKYDFDGDGIDDLVTKNDRATYRYPKAGTYTPKVKVSYRGFVTNDIGEEIIVKNAVKPMFQYQMYDKAILIRDTSIGDVANRLLCMDSRKCRKENNVRSSTGAKATLFTYPDYGKYVARYDIQDIYGNRASQKTIIDVKKPTTNYFLNVLSIPAMSTSGSIAQINVGKNLDNQIVWYIGYQGKGECYVDADIGEDSQRDGDPSRNKDFLCNTVYTHSYDPSFETTVARVYYAGANGQSVTRDINIRFLDFDLDLPPATRKVYDEITALVRTLDVSQPQINELKTLLLDLRKNLSDSTETAAVIPTIRSFLSEQKPALTQEQKDKLDLILKSLDTEATQAADSAGVLDRAKAEILLLTPNALKSNIEEHFKAIEKADGDKESIKKSLQDLLKELGAAVAPSSDSIGPNQIDPVDFESVRGNICQIANFYEIQTTNCVQETVGEEPAPTQPTVAQTATSTLGTALRWIGIILGVLVLGFIILVVVFAIKARMSQK